MSIVKAVTCLTRLEERPLWVGVFLLSLERQKRELGITRSNDPRWEQVDVERALACADRAERAANL